MKWEYSISTNTIWASFDHGQVEAPTEAKALELAKLEVKYAFDKANSAFNHCDNTLGFRLEFDETQIELTKVKNTSDELLQNIDYKALMLQKESLVANTHNEEVNGVIHLIDAIQDHAVDVLGKSEQEVFNLD